MTTDELSICGYCCTGSELKARSPTSTSTRFTTNASTGCLMKISVKDRMAALPLLGRRRRGRGLQCLHSHAFAQLERARRCEPLPHLDSAEHDHRLTQRGAAL